MGELRDAVGERGGRDRGDRVEPGVGRSRLRTPSARRGRSATPSASPSASVADELTAMSSDAVVGLLDPVDEAGDQQQRDRVVHPRLALERAGQPAAQLRPRRTAKIAALSVAAIAEPTIRPSSVPRSKSQMRPRAGDQRGDQGPDGGQRDRRAEHRPDLAPAGASARPRRGSGPGRSCPASGSARRRRSRPRPALGADQHPEPEEEDQAGHPDPVGDHGAAISRPRAGGRRSGSARRRDNAPTSVSAGR